MGGHKVVTQQPVLIQVYQERSELGYLTAYGLNPYERYMSEILVSQDGATATVLPATAEEKARQVPDPVTFHILCMLPKAEEEFSETGILKSATAMYHEELLSPVLFVAKLGPDAFKDEKRFPSGPSCKVGDFIITRPNTGTRMKIHGTEWRLISDDAIEAVVQDPRGIQRP